MDDRFIRDELEREAKEEHADAKETIALVIFVIGWWLTTLVTCLGVFLALLGKI